MFRAAFSALLHVCCCLEDSKYSLQPSGMAPTACGAQSKDFTPPSLDAGRSNMHHGLCHSLFRVPDPDLTPRQLLQKWSTLGPAHCKYAVRGTNNAFHLTPQQHQHQTACSPLTHRQATVSRAGSPQSRLIVCCTLHYIGSCGASAARAAAAAGA
jgi:hypothetical protein